jgi:translocation and assembly module TamB
MRRLLRWAAHFSFVLIVGAVATGLGVSGAMTRTAAGRALLARLVTDQSGRMVRGQIRIGAVGGTFYSTLVLDSVEVRDTTGFPLASFERIAFRFSLANLLARRIVLNEVRIDRPRIHLVQHREGRLNFEEVLRLGEGPGGGTPPLVVLNDLQITDGIVTIRTPWSPPGHLRGTAARDSALRAARLVPGRRIEDQGLDGLVQLRTIEGLSARFAVFRLVTPDRRPIRAVIDSLAAQLSDPLLTLTDLKAELHSEADSLWFSLDRAALAATVMHGEGVLSWPRDTVLFNFELQAPELALADLRFISPDFPDLTGSGRVIAYSPNGIETQYDLRSLRLAGGGTGVTGSMVALTHRIRGLGFRNLDLVLDNLDLEIVRPYLDTIPFQGRLSGGLTADGYFDRMRVDFDWTFADPRIAGTPSNQIAMQGEVTLGGPDGLRFWNTQLTSSDLDLATVRLAAPAVILEGRMAGVGVLEGPWRNVDYTGRLIHNDGDRGESIATGRFGLDTRDTLTSFDAEFALTPLDFSGIRRTFRTLTASGRIWGPVSLRGRIDHLAVTTDVQGEIGRIQSEGTIAALPPRWSAENLRVRFTDFDLASWNGSGRPTLLTGDLWVNGTVDSAVAPEGTLALRLGPSWLGEFPLDSGMVTLAMADSILTLDSAAVRWQGGSASGTGTLGWTAGHAGEVAIQFAATSLAALDSMLTTIAGVDREPELPTQRLDGSMTGTLRLSGTLDSLTVLADVSGEGIRWETFQLNRGEVRLEWLKAGEAGVRTTIRVDSLQAGRLRFSDLQLEANGDRDSLTWQGGGRGRQALLAANGHWLGGERPVLGITAFDLDLSRDRFSLLSPVRLTLGDSVGLDQPVMLSASDGSAQIQAEGSIPWRGPGELDLRMFGVDLRSIASLLQRDTTGIRGWLQSDLRIGGTGKAPTFRGTAALTGPVFGDFRAPLSRLAMNYRERRLDANLTFWRTGRPVMEVGAALPIDLAWLDLKTDRQLGGPLAIRLKADSMDLAVLEAFTPNLRRVSGTVRMDATVSGTWDEPRLGGHAEILSGAATVPVLRTSYGPIEGRVVFSGDSILVDSMVVAGESGNLRVAGFIQLERLTKPVLGLDLQAQGFKLLDIPDFLTLEAGGNVQLRGPITHPVMTGSATARNTVLYFNDLITKSVVNLEDPLFADLVDTAAIRKRQLGAAFQSRFLDSLEIRNFTFLAADRVWLRSNEANIQMEGSVAVNKIRRNYRLEGTLTAPRGTYTVKVGPLSKGFDVTRGTVRYFGTPDLNATLDIEARHPIRSSESGSGRDIEVIARITGDLLRPELHLESNIRPPLSQSDIVSLLLLGRPLNAQVASAEQSVLMEVGTQALASALASEVERALVQTEGGVGVDMVEIRPGTSYRGVAAGSSLTRLAAGWQVGTQWFVTLRTGFCLNGGAFDFRNFGVGLEYRISERLTFAATTEPVQVCIAGAPTGSTIRHQFGTDLRWGKEY